MKTLICCLKILTSKNDYMMDSSHQNSWKTLSFSNSYTLTHQKLISKQLYNSGKLIVQVWKALIIYCLKIFHSTKRKNDLIFGFSTTKQLENTLFHWFIYSHTWGINFQPTLQPWPNHGHSNKNTYCFMIDDLPLNQKQKWINTWIQHIKTVGKHSPPVIHMLSYTRN